MDLKLGDTIFVTKIDFYKESTPTIEEYKIVKTNKSSIYAENIKKGHELRFDRNSKMASKGWSYSYRFFLNEKEFWDLINDRNKKEKLSALINKNLRDCDVDTLEAICELMEIKTFEI